MDPKTSHAKHSEFGIAVALERKPEDGYKVLTYHILPIAVGERQSTGHSQENR